MKEGFELKKDTLLEDPLTGKQRHYRSAEAAAPQKQSELESRLQKGFTLDRHDSLLTEVSTTEQETAATVYTPEDEEVLLKSRFWSSPLLWLLLLVLSLGGLEAYSLLKELITTDTTLGLTLSGAFLVILIFFCLSCVKEIRTMLQFKRIDEHKAEVQQALMQGSFPGAVKVCHTLAKDSGSLTSQAFEVFAQSLQPHFTPAEVFALYERLILKDQDARAKAIIIKRSRENGLIVALSPLAWLDMVLTLARSLRMIRELSEVYGLRLTFLGRLQLYKRVLRNLVLIGITELATDAVVDVLGAGAAGKLNASLGQGIAAGIYSTRLGYMTMKALRPFKVSPEVLTLGQLRKELLTRGQLHELLDPKKK